MLTTPPILTLGFLLRVEKTHTQARDADMLAAAARTPIGAILSSTLRAAVRRVALTPNGGAAPTFTDTTANALLQTAASTIASQSRYAAAGLTLPSALPWVSAKRIATAFLDALTAARYDELGTRVGTLLMTLPAPPADAQTQADIATLVATVESDVTTRLSSGGGGGATGGSSVPGSSGASTSSGSSDTAPPPAPPAQPQPVAAAAAEPFALDGTLGVSDNVARLAASALRRNTLAVAERTTLDAALEQALGLLQEGGGAEARRQLLASNAFTALTSTGVAYVWAASVDRAERGVSSVDEYARDIVDACSNIASALFSAALGF